MKIEKVVCDRCGCDNAKEAYTQDGYSICPAGGSSEPTYITMDLCHECCIEFIAASSELSEPGAKILREWRRHAKLAP